MNNRSSSAADSFHALLTGTTADPHSVLGMHTEKSGIVIRVYDPCA